MREEQRGRRELRGTWGTRTTGPWLAGDHAHPSQLPPDLKASSDSSFTHFLPLTLLPPLKRQTQTESEAAVRTTHPSSLVVPDLPGPPPLAGLIQLFPGAVYWVTWDIVVLRVPDHVNTTCQPPVRGTSAASPVCSGETGEGGSQEDTFRKREKETRRVALSLVFSRLRTRDLFTTVFILCSCGIFIFLFI